MAAQRTLGEYSGRIGGMRSVLVAGLIEVEMSIPVLGFVNEYYHVGVRCAYMVLRLGDIQMRLLIHSRNEHHDDSASWYAMLGSEHWQNVGLATSAVH